MSRDILAGNLRDLRRVNRWLGGVRLTRLGIEQLLRPHHRDPVVIADIGAGCADIPLAIARQFEAHAVRPTVLAFDVSADMLHFTPRGAGIDCALADGRGLPLASDSVDVAICSLTLHHLQPHDAVAALREMGRVARRGVVVNDLVRTWPALGGAWLMSRLFSRNLMTHHDAPLSVRRAYTRTELADMARRAGLRPLAFRSWLGYRVAMTAVRE